MAIRPRLRAAIAPSPCHSIFFKFGKSRAGWQAPAYAAARYGNCRVPPMMIDAWRPRRGATGGRSPRGPCRMTCGEMRQQPVCRLVVAMENHGDTRLTLSLADCRRNLVVCSDNCNGEGGRCCEIE